MTQDIHSADMAELAELSAKKRRFLLALFGNLLLLVVMVGGPFVRGIVRAHRMWGDFGRFGACLYGGTPVEGGGLGMPIGSEAHFAARLLNRPEGWPGRCQRVLSELSPDEPIFLLPNVKTAESDVRAAIKLVERELNAALVRASGERLTTRPLRAVEQLRAMLSRHALSAGAFEVPEDDAFRLDKDQGLPIPTRVPLYASRDALLSLWGTDSDFHALAVDFTGVSYVNVGAGGMSQQRLPRPKLLEAFLPDTGEGLFVWAMSRKRCHAREEGCAHKAMGVASLSSPLTAMPLPRWLGAHPAARIDRSVLRIDQKLFVAAEAADRRVQVRAFELPPGASDAAASEQPPLPAKSTWGEPSAGSPWLARFRGEPLVLFAVPGEERTTLLLRSEQGNRALAELPPSREAWVQGSVCGDHVSLTFGTEQRLLVGELSPARDFEVLSELPLGLTDVLDERDASHDRVRNLCTDPSQALVLLRDASDTLRAIACRERACHVETVAGKVQTFAAQKLSPGGALVAYAGAKNLAQIRLMRLNERGVAVGREQAPSACWAPLGGLCGTPTLARVGSRLLLGAREGTDLMLLESPDDGIRWEPMRGLKKHH